ncbi:hypothetical protein CHS0354_021586 [Potamilus streckersoni]|uniref:Ankyrin repeat domain-containing protein 63 n=1 Tax=Potamilus streckersoni TaxID=2493646 RepID=A0AAE0SNY0_9BIVA|nr:hypothetical protein CHS0354_021586 [Potamilus streckersoni]
MSRRQKVRKNNDMQMDLTSDARVLFDAVRQGKKHLIRFILEAAMINVVDARDLHGRTPLIQCLNTKEEQSREALVRMLLQFGADVNSRDDFGRTALSYACEKSCNDVVRILVKHHNIDPDLYDMDGNTPLIYSAMVGNDIAVEILIRHFRRLGLQIDHANKDGFTAVLMAAKQGHTTCAQILIGQGKASVHVRDHKYFMNVNQWLERRGLTTDDVLPIRDAGNGRGRFMKIARLAALCSSGSKPGPSKNADDYRYYQSMLAKSLSLDDEDASSKDSDATSLSEESLPKVKPTPPSIPKASRLERTRRVYPLQDRQKLKSQATQTFDSDIEEQFDHISESKDLHRPRLRNSMSDANKTEKEFKKMPKRCSLPEIKSRRKSKGSLMNLSDLQSNRSLEHIPDVIFAKVDSGGGKMLNLKLKPDRVKDKFFWRPCFDTDDASSKGDVFTDQAEVSSPESDNSTTSPVHTPIF